LPEQALNPAKQGYCEAANSRESAWGGGN